MAEPQAIFPSAMLSPIFLVGQVLMVPRLLVCSAKVALAKKLRHKNNDPDNKSSPEIGSGKLKRATDGKFHQQHQNNRKCGIYQSRYHGVPAGFEISNHRVLLAQR